jgi:hypothetical protein
MTELTLADMIRSGYTMDHLTKSRLEKIEAEMLQEPCELCGCPTREAGQLFAQDAKDDMGRHIVQMVCAKCMTKANKTKQKSKKGGRK